MRTSVLVGLMLVVAGCSQGKGSLSVSSRSTPSSAATNSTSAVNAIDGGNGVLITHIRMVVRQVEVEKAESTSGGNTISGGNSMPGGNTVAGGGTIDVSQADTHHGSGDDVGDDDDGGEVVGGPFLIDLSGADIMGAIHWQADMPLDPGTYEEVEFKINTLPAAKAGTDAGLIAMADAHASIIAEGTLDGVPFTFSTPISVTQEREGSFTIAEGGKFDITLDVDPSGWFKSSSGGLLNPNDPTAQGEILANIRASIRLIHDEDHDGMDDDHGGQGGGSGSGGHH
jgi:hypothetical protein